MICASVVLPRPGRAEEEDMIERVAAPLGGLDEHAQILPRRLLPDELVERLGPQRRVEILGAAVAGDDALLLHAQSFSASAGPVEQLSIPLEARAISVLASQYSKGLTSWIADNSFSPPAPRARRSPSRRSASAQAPRPRSRNDASYYVDAQGALDGFDEPEPGRYVPNQRLITAIRERRIDLISATVGPVGTGDNRYRDSVEGIAGYDRLIAAHPNLLAKIESAADIRAARRRASSA